MNILSNRFTRGFGVVAALFMLSACATPLVAPDGAQMARSKLTELQSNQPLATLAAVEIKEAEAAVQAAEVPRGDSAHANHLVLVADHKVEIARARAQARLYEDQRRKLGEERERSRLDARTREVERSYTVARSARADAVSARDDAESARQQSDELRRQIAELNARETDRGLVVTLGDLLFDTGQSALTGGAGANLDKLSAFLREHEDRTVSIEGHTDSVGSESSNFELSQRRADSVKSYLVRQGIAANRLTTRGLGEGSPVAGNDTATGRQQNRRVEVIISNVTATSSRN